MVGLYLSVWVRKALAVHVRGIQTTSAATGWGGYLGNKGKYGNHSHEQLLECVAAIIITRNRQAPITLSYVTGGER